MSARAATACGLLAILLWSTAAGLIRSLTEFFGPIGGSALLYSVGALLLLAFLGPPRLRKVPGRYLLSGTALFVGYEVCLSLALGFASSRSQAIEVSVVNYLWPSLTVLFALFMNGQKARWLLLPGTAMALLGILWIVSGEQLALANIVARVALNPLSYSLGLACAVLFALYCNVTRRYASGQNLVAWFFVVTAVVLWIKYAFSQESLPSPDLGAGVQLLATGIAMAAGYALWNIGVLRGNMTLLATASYTAPVLSSAFASLWLGAALSVEFWQGTVLVMLGSLACWYSTRGKSLHSPEP